MNWTAFTLLLTVAAFGADEFQWSYYTNMDEVHSFVEYSGKVYVGTSGGLAAISKMDHSVDHFLKSDIPMTSNVVTALNVDSISNLHVCTYGSSWSSGRSIFNGSTWKQEVDSFSLGVSNRFVTLPDGQIVKTTANAVMDKEGKLWHAGSIGPYYKDGQTNHTVLNGLPGNSFLYLKLATDSEGNLFCVKDSSIYKLNGEQWTQIVSVSFDSRYLSSFAVAKNAYYIGTKGGRIYVVTAGGSTHYTKASGEIPSDTVSLLYTDKSGHVWGATNKGVICHDGSEWSVIDLNYCDLPYNSIGQIIADSTGNVWATTMSYILKFDGDKWHKWESQEIGLSGTGVIALVANKTGVYAAKQKKIITFTGDAWETYVESVPGGSNSSIIRLGADKVGNLWCAVGTDGLVKVNDQKTCTTLKPSVLTGGVLTDHVIAISVDISNNIYFETNNLRFGKVNGETVDAISFAVPQIPNALSFTVDHEGTFWLAASNSGFLADWGTGYNFFSLDVIEPFASTFTVYIDRAGETWIGTNFAGLVHGATNVNSIEECTVFRANSSGLNGDLPTLFITEDLQGSIWLTGNYGVTRIRRDTVSGIISRPGKSTLAHTILFDGQQLLIDLRGRIMNGARGSQIKGSAGVYISSDLQGTGRIVRIRKR